MSSRNEMSRLVLKLRKQGFSVDRTGSGHWKVCSDQSESSVVLPFSPRKVHLKSIHCDLKKIGYKL
jgi:hypothetical protein